MKINLGDLKSVDVAAKIYRAFQLIEGLKKLTSQATAVDSDMIAFQRGFFKNDVDYEFQVKLDSPISQQISIILGEICYHLRSSLDHLVWQAVIANNGTPNSNHRFPVCTDEQAFKEMIQRGYLKGTSEKFVKEVRHRQPFNQENPRTNLLWVLSTLNKIDQRHLLSVVIAKGQIGEKLAIPPGYASLDLKVEDPEHVKLTTEWQSILTVTLPHRAPSFSAKMEPNISLTAADILEVSGYAVDDIVSLLVNCAFETGYWLEQSMK